MPRLFTALEIPYSVSMPLSLLQRGLTDARWIEAQDFHITLRFFGDIENHIADEIVSQLSSIKYAPFSLSLEGLDVFGSKKPRSLYARVAPCDALNNLQTKIEHIAHRLAIPNDKTRFVPHVTLARLNKVKLDDLVKYLSSHGGFMSRPFQVERFTLMSSRQSVGGGPYIIEEAWSLNG